MISFPDSKIIYSCPNNARFAVTLHYIDVLQKIGGQLMLDNFGRNVNYIRVSLTDRCNLRCLYCMPEKGINKLKHEDILRYEEVINIIKTFAKLGGKKVRYTGGEPLILKDIDYLIAQTAKISGIEDISITTNGTLLYDMADELKKAGLKRVNISIDSLKPEKYSHITRGGDLNKVLLAVEKCMQIGISPVKINVVLIKGINDDEVGDFIRLTKDLPLHVRFIELMPMGEGAKYYEHGRMSSDEIIIKFPQLISLHDKHQSTAKMYKLKNSKGKVGFITPMSCKFCSDCNRIRLTSVGTIKPCLHSSEEINIKAYLENDVLLETALRSAILGKPEEHHLVDERASRSLKMMYQIGG